MGWFLGSPHEAIVLLWDHIFLSIYEIKLTNIERASNKIARYYKSFFFQKKVELLKTWREQQQCIGQRTNGSRTHWALQSEANPWGPLSCLVWFFFLLSFFVVLFGNVAKRTCPVSPVLGGCRPSEIENWGSEGQQQHLFAEHNDRLHFTCQLRIPTAEHQQDWGRGSGWGWVSEKERKKDRKHMSKLYRCSRRWIWVEFLSSGAATVCSKRAADYCLCSCSDILCIVQ